jgi:hypothetical protein
MFHQVRFIPCYHRLQSWISCKFSWAAGSRAAETKAGTLHFQPQNITRSGVQSRGTTEQKHNMKYAVQRTSLSIGLYGAGRAVYFSNISCSMLTHARTHAHYEYSTDCMQVITPRFKNSNQSRGSQIAIHGNLSAVRDDDDSWDYKETQQPQDRLKFRLW